MLQVSTHGDLQKQVIIWQYPGLTQLASLGAHSARVLYMAMSPDGESVATGGGDEILCYWNVFSTPHSQKVSAQFIHWEKVFLNQSHFFRITFILTEICNKYLQRFSTSVLGEHLSPEAVYRHPMKSHQFSDIPHFVLLFIIILNVNLL
jgi:hypothetical protein